MKILKELIIPKDFVNDEKVLIRMIYFKDGDFISKGDVVIEFETSKTVVSLDSDQDGYIFYNYREGDDVLIGSVVAEIWDEKKRIELSKIFNDNTNESQLNISGIKTIYSKRAKELIAQNYIDEKVFEGQDFVNHDNVLLFLDKTKKCFRSTVKFSTSDRNSLLNICDSNEVPKRAYFNTKFENDKERIVIICPSTIGIEVIWDIIEGQTNKEIVGYVVDEKYKADINLPFLDCNVFDFPQRIDKKTYDTVIIAMGGSLKSMQSRKKIFNHYVHEGLLFTNLISNKANIGINVRIGVGNIIGSGVFIGTGSSIGDNNFVSYMTTIGHHNTIGNNNLFAPGVMMSGLDEIGDDCILTTGVNFIDKIKIGNRVVLPLGYNVVSNLEDDTIIKMKI